MGLLDDAIREHLDLKRRHGADPAEIERAEREALGPVRRGPEPVDALLEADAMPYDDAAAEPPAAAATSGETEMWVMDEAWEDEEDDHPPLTFEAPPSAVEPDPPAAIPPPHPAPAREPAQDATVEHRSEGAHPAQPGPEEDVLEETPEFLSETPDHDRLWFEQRPPRDFDFEG